LPSFLLLFFCSCKEGKGPGAVQPPAPEPATLEYYSGQSAITDPGQYAYLYDSLPESVAELCRVTQRLLLHPFHTERYGVELTEQRRKEVRLREVEDILHRAIELDERMLIENREPQKRVTGHCRDYAVLLCSFLRYKGIPARVRVGFATYFGTELHQSHWICEYWSQNRKKWITVDAQLDDIQSRYYKIDFDPLDVPAGKFLCAGQEYKLVSNKSDVSNHINAYDGEDFLHVIRRSLIQDLAALNKMEVEVWDVIDLMEIDEDQNSETLNLLDRIAEMTASQRDRLPELRSLYENHSELQIH